MSRTIKFRAWDKRVDEMYLDVGTLPMSADHYSRIAGDELAYRHDHPNIILMQYTGLKDKNGVEIYEGDIVAIKFWLGDDIETENGEIKWHQEASAFKWLSGEPSDGSNYWLSESDVKNREVIGNIYENPELLESK